jgi:hypothetical protein
VQQVHFVEQGRKLLDLVDDDLWHAAARVDLLAQPLGGLEQAAELIRTQEVDPQRIGIGAAQERALAGLPRPPQEERLLARRRQAGCAETLLPIIMMIGSHSRASDWAPVGNTVPQVPVDYPIEVLWILNNAYPFANNAGAPLSDQTCEAAAVQCAI